jgi:DNA uptake protein ComE-like DNA-binding protein
MKRIHGQTAGTKPAILLVDSMRSSALLVSISLTAMACVAPSDDVQVPENASANLGLIEGSPDALGLLGLLNHPSTTFEVLDLEVPLDKRAAQNLIHHRDGADGVFGSNDDAPFTSVAQVDAVPWVGAKTIDLLVSYARQRGWVPQGDDVIGVWDDVSFTEAEAKKTLVFANTASHSLLDRGLSLDSRAARSITEARPIQNVETLSKLYYVGKSALLTLKEHAQLVNIYDERFASDAPASIPDGTLDGSRTMVHINGAPDMRVQASFVADIRHDAPEELRIVLTSPSGRTWNIIPGQEVRADLGQTKNINGKWGLHVVDAVPSNTGELYSWSLDFSAIY